MIREEVLYQFYLSPTLIAAEIVAIRAALPYWVGANIFLNRDKALDERNKNEWPTDISASAILEKHGIDWKYKRENVRFCHVEYELRRQAAEIIFDVDNPKRHDVRSEVVALLNGLGVYIEEDHLAYRGDEDDES